MSTHRVAITIYYDLLTGDFYPSSDAKHPFRLLRDTTMSKRKDNNLDFFALSQAIDLTLTSDSTVDEDVLSLAIERSKIEPRHFPPRWRYDHDDPPLPKTSPSDIDVDID